MSELVFLKLGGSLITNKARRDTAQHAIINRLSVEIASARSYNPNLQILLGHGSGSFGHMAAKKIPGFKHVFGKLRHRIQGNI